MTSLELYRSEEKRSIEEISSDAENERVFPETELMKRRLSLDKKSNIPGTCSRRPSLPVLNSKFILFQTFILLLNLKLLSFDIFYNLYFSKVKISSVVITLLFC